MKIEIIRCLQDNYSYLIIDEKKNTACVVDPSESGPIIEYLENNKINLKFILNTHHHYDHIGGNKDLKKRYEANIIGFKNDKNRIPDIDILVNDQEIWKHENFEAKIIHIPGHTLGHICFYFQMYKSLKKLKELPYDTKVFCGHEYTLNNSKFCIMHDQNNENLKNKIIEITKKLQNNLPTIPTTIKEELECNVFLRADNLKTFSKLRDLKDNF